jgi:hypothetical protein
VNVVQRSVLQELIERLRGGLVPRPVWQRALRERGLDPLVMRSLASRAHLGEAWLGVKRVDWVVEIAAVARVEPAVIGDGLDELLDELAPWSAAAFDRAVLLDVRTRLAERELTPEALVGAIGPHLLSAVDAAPEVRTAHAELKKAEQWRQRERIQRAADAYDEVHAATHGLLADRFRRRVPTEAVRFALEGVSAHPYR